MTRRTEAEVAQETFVRASYCSFHFILHKLFSTNSISLDKLFSRRQVIFLIKLHIAHFTLDFLYSHSAGLPEGGILIARSSSRQITNETTSTPRPEQPPFPSQVVWTTAYLFFAPSASDSKLHPKFHTRDS
jgi:hypothetical protein